MSHPREALVVSTWVHRIAQVVAAFGLTMVRSLAATRPLGQTMLAARTAQILQSQRFHSDILSSGPFSMTKPRCALKILWSVLECGIRAFSRTWSSGTLGDILEVLQWRIHVALTAAFISLGLRAQEEKHSLDSNKDGKERK